MAGKGHELPSSAPESSAAPAPAEGAGNPWQDWVNTHSGEFSASIRETEPPAEAEPVLSARAQLEQRMREHPEEFGLPYVPIAGTEAERLTRASAEEDVAARRLTPVEEVQAELGLPS